jgi:hypothetical protein
MKNQNQIISIRRTVGLSLIMLTAGLSFVSSSAQAEMRIYLDKSGQPFTKDSTLKIQNENLEKKIDSQGRYFFIYKESEKKEVIAEELAPKEREQKQLLETKLPADPAPSTKFKTAHGLLESAVDENGKIFYRYRPLSLNSNRMSSATAMTLKEKQAAEAEEQLRLQKAFFESQGVTAEILFGTPLEKKYYFNGQAFYKFKGLPPISRELSTYEVDQLSDQDRAQFYSEPTAKPTQKVSNRVAVQK